MIPWYGDGVKQSMTVEVGDRGRLVIPAAVRGQLGLRPGSKLNVRVERGALILMTPEAAEQELWGMFAEAPVSLVADRRAEADRENARS